MATRTHGREECVAGAKVSLFRDGQVQVTTQATDAFGDFRFDGLEENSGSHTITIEHAGHETQTVEVTIEKSLYFGTIFLTPV